MKHLKIYLLLISSLMLCKIAHPQVNLISLNDKKLTINKNNFFVTDVIDARIEQCNIGFVHNGHDFTLRPVDIDGELSEAILSLFGPYNRNTTDKTPIVIKINRLYFNEYWEDGIYFKVLEINLDFYTVENGNYFNEFMAGHYIQFYGGQPLKSIDDNIVKALNRCYNEFIHRMHNNLGYHQRTDEHEISINTITEKVMTNPEGHKRREGVYYTFNGFRDNVVDTVTQFLPNTNKNAYTKYGLEKFVFKNKDLETAQIWGVYYNNMLYIKVYDLYIPVADSNGTYHLKEMIAYNPPSNHITGASWGYFLLGPVGALAGAAAGTVIDINTRYKILKSKYIIDMVTGMPVPEDKPPHQKSKSKIVFCLIKHTYFDLEIIIDGKKKCNLLPYSYFTYPVNPDKNKLNVCLKSITDEFCDSIPTDFCNTQYIEMIVKKDGKVSFNPKPDKKTISKIIRNIEKDLLQKSVY